MIKIGAEEFRQKVLDALKKVDSRYEEDLFFTQYRDGYNICYKPSLSGIFTCGFQYLYE